MESTPKGNDLEAPAARLCLSLEEHRRSAPAGTRSAAELRAHFFRYDERSATDRIFRHLPREVRGPILAGWGIRGRNVALRDDDATVEAVVHDAFLAGDIDDARFEAGLTPGVVIRWIDLADWWSFWRDGSLGHEALGAALGAAYSAGLLDAPALFGEIDVGGERVRGLETYAAALSRPELGDWIDRIYRLGDASPEAVLAALGWERMIERTPIPVLTSLVDAVAARSGLAVAGGAARPPKAVGDALAGSPG